MVPSCYGSKVKSREYGIIGYSFRTLHQQSLHEAVRPRFTSRFANYLKHNDEDILRSRTWALFRRHPESGLPLKPSKIVNKDMQSQIDLRLPTFTQVT